MAFSIGIDLGGTKVAGILVNSENEIITEIKLNTQCKEQSTVIERIKAIISQLLAENEVSPHNLTGIGLGVAGHVNAEQGIIIYCPNLPIKNLNLKSLLQKEYNIPVFIENDANSAAIGEKHFGLAKNNENFVCVTLGTGIGAGIFINGSIYRGPTGSAGELGHMILDFSHDAPLCGCGNRGCFEALASGTAIARKAKEIFARHPNSFISAGMGAEREITAQMVAEMAQKENKFALKIFKDVANIIGIGFANIVNLFNPEKIIVTGSLVEGEDLILKPAIKTMMRRAFSTNARVVTVVKSELNLITLKKVLFEPSYRNSYISFVCVTYILRISFRSAFSLTETFCSVINFSGCLIEWLYQQLSSRRKLGLSFCQMPFTQSNGFFSGDVGDVDLVISYFYLCTYPFFVLVSVLHPQFKKLIEGFKTANRG
jgi:glucokinase